MLWAGLIAIISSIFLVNFNLAMPFLSPTIIIGSVVEKEVTLRLPAKKPEVAEVDIQAKSLAVLDAKNNIFLFEKNSNEPLQIASITKLMTALVFLDYNPGWDNIYEIQRADRVDGGKIHVYLGDKVKVKDLFYTMLIASDNTAAVALIHAAGLTEEDFVLKMNAKAKELGFINAYFADPVGLDSKNVATAREIAYLAQAALAKPEIATAVGTDKYEFTTSAGVNKKIASTDYLLSLFNLPNIKIIGGKTGYTELAGYCFVGKFINSDNREIISVVLNTKSDNERFRQTTKLVDWIFANFVW